MHRFDNYIPSKEEKHTGNCADQILHLPDLRWVVSSLDANNFWLADNIFDKSHIN